LYAVHQQRQVQGAGAARHGDRTRPAGDRSEVGFECVEVRSDRRHPTAVEGRQQRLALGDANVR
jgi:hypothetical protein